jgi:hypothetical protein
MEQRARNLEHQSKAIVFGDYSGLDGEDFVEAIGQQEALSLESTDKNILHLLNFTGCRMSTAAKERADQMMKTLQSKGYTVKTACYGITGIQRVIANAVKRDMYFAKSEADARDWLVAD